jgi:hydrogenase nickel incorporation protein HypA/HybF
MHELSIAYSLVETAVDAARQAGIERVDAVHLRLGALSGVVKESLLFGYEIAAQNTLLEGSQLEIEVLPVIVYCGNCQREVELVSLQRFRCPVCDTPSGDIRQGRELEIRSLEVRDGDPSYT